MRIAISVFVTLFVFCLDPFGLKSATNDTSVEIYSRLASGFYKHTGQDRIAVALMTDKAAEEMADGYPVPMRIHGEVIAGILCAGATSVFIDVNFRWERFVGDAEEFIDALSMRREGRNCRKLDRDEVRKHPVQVILGHTPSRTAGCDPIFPEFNSPDANCSKTADKNPFADLSKVARIISLPEPKTDLRYQLSEAMPSSDKMAMAARPSNLKLDLSDLEKRSVRLYSPAVASLFVMCAANPGQSPLCDRSKLDLDTTLVTRWGWEITRKDRDLRRWLNGTCINQSPGSIFQEHWIRRAAETGNVCPYHDTMTANDIRTAVAYGTTTPDPSRPWTGHYILDEIFGGRSVFYGLQITGIADYVNSPTLGRMPGVYAHAMSLDNLLTEGTGFWREPGPAFGSEYWNWSLVIELILGLGLLLVGWRIDERNDAVFSGIVLKRPRAGRWLTRSYDKAAYRLGRGLSAIFWTRKEDEGRAAVGYRLHWARTWLFLVIALLIVIGFAALEMLLFHWPPNDWIALFTLILAAKPGHRKYVDWAGRNWRWRQE